MFHAGTCSRPKLRLRGAKNHDFFSASYTSIDLQLPLPPCQGRGEATRNHHCAANAAMPPALVAENIVGLEVQPYRAV